MSLCAPAIDCALCVALVLEPVLEPVPVLGRDVAATTITLLAMAANAATSASAAHALLRRALLYSFSAAWPYFPRADTKSRKSPLWPGNLQLALGEG